MEVSEIKRREEKSLDQHRLGGGVSSSGGSLIDVGARTQTAIVIQMEQNRGEQINPRLITPLWAVSEWECMCARLLYMCVFKVCVAAPLCRQQEKELSQPPTGPYILLYTHMRTHTEAGFGDELLIRIGRHHAS